MAIYYVRKSGSDANPGTSPSQAKLTIDAAIALLAAGGTDIIYVGPGVYREKVFLDVSGAGVGSEHRIIGDEFGEFTGDAPGPIRISAHNSDDDLTPERNQVIECDCSHVIIENTILHGCGTGFANSDGIVYLNPTANRTNLRFRRVLFAPARGNCHIQKDGTSSYAVVLERGTVLQESVSWGSVQVHAGALTIDLVGVVHLGCSSGDWMFSTNGGSGMTVNLNKVYLGPLKSGAAYFNHFAADITATMRNCQLRMGDADFDAGGSGFTITKSHNRYEGANPPSLDTGEVTGWAGDQLLWALLRAGRRDANAIEGSGTATGAPALDVLERTVPQGAGVDIGPAENGDYPIKDTTTFRTAAPSMASRSGRRLLKILEWGVKGGQSNTFTVYARRNSAYTATPKPRLIVKANPALGLTTDTIDEMTVAADTWEQLSVSVTPTADGVGEIWLETYSTEAGAQAWFDDFDGPRF